MARIRASKGVVATFAAIVLVAASFAAPSSAHDSANIGHNWRQHYRPLAKKTFYAKRESNARFVNVGEVASDAALLDGLDSTEFAAAVHAHAGEDVTSGTVAEARIAVAIARVADVFDLVLDSDGSGSGLDADLLDGLSSSAFVQAGETKAQVWRKEAADTLPLTGTSERIVFTAPADLTITEILIEPAAGLTASDTNFATISVSRRDADGGNRTTVDSGTTQTTGTGDWTAFGTISLGSVGAASLSAGQKITIEITKTGLGVVVPVLAIQIEYTVP